MPGLGGDRGGLGHAVADRHLGHAHPVDDLLHHLDRAGRARHDAGSQAAQVEPLEAVDRELGDEHRRDAVERGAALLLDRFQGLDRVEARGGDDHRGAVGGRRQVPHHHAEAVIEGDRDADLVLGRVPAEFPTKKPLLRMLWWDRVAPFGNPVVPEVYWMLIGSSAESSIASSAAASASRPAVEERLPVLGAEQHDLLQVGAARADLGDHRGVVGGLQLLRGDQQLAARLVEHELELAGPVGGVDVDQDRAELGGGVLGEGPLGAVRRPDADAVALVDAGCQQAEGEGVDLGVQLRVGEPRPDGRSTRASRSG